MGELTTKAQCLYAANLVLNDINMSLIDKKLESRDDIIAVANMLRAKSNELINIDYELSEIELFEFVEENNVPFFGQRSGQP